MGSSPDEEAKDISSQIPPPVMYTTTSIVLGTGRAPAKESIETCGSIRGDKPMHGPATFSLEAPKASGSQEEAKAFATEILESMGGLEPCDDPAAYGDIY